MRSDILLFHYGSSYHRLSLENVGPKSGAAILHSFAYVVSTTPSRVLHVLNSDLWPFHMPYKLVYAYAVYARIDSVCVTICGVVCDGGEKLYYIIHYHIREYISNNLTRYFIYLLCLDSRTLFEYLRFRLAMNNNFPARSDQEFGTLRWWEKKNAIVNHDISLDISFHHRWASDLLVNS